MCITGVPNVWCWNVKHYKRLIAAEVFACQAQEFGLNFNASVRISINPSLCHSYRLLLNVKIEQTTVGCS